MCCWLANPGGSEVQPLPQCMSRRRAGRSRYDVAMQSLTPKEIVGELDKYIIGQHQAKRAVAVAIRNRWRRRQLDEHAAHEVYPKNIIMIGPTGVGKTEIARRLAKLTGAPFVKVEASKYTEVGYHGRDVESMIRDLVDQAVSIVREEEAERVRIKAQEHADERIVDLLLPAPRYPSYASRSMSTHEGDEVREQEPSPEEQEASREKTRKRLLAQVKAGTLDDRQVEVTTSDRPGVSMMFANMGLEQMEPEMASMLEKMVPEQQRRRKVTVREARRILAEQETEQLLDREKITSEAISRAQNDGIIFLDEIDKIAVGSGDGAGGGRGPDVSRQGVQRDLLPIVEGSAVNTRHGVVHTDHILFVAAGAFHLASPSDLMPELQGRFPIRVELSPLTRDDFVRILREPDNSLANQQQKLLGVEGLNVSFEDGAIEAMAEYAARANATLGDIGARRLMTIIERVFEEINFDAPDRVKSGDKKFVVTADFVKQQVGALIEDEDLSKFVL